MGFKLWGRGADTVLLCGAGFATVGTAPHPAGQLGLLQVRIGSSENVALPGSPSKASSVYCQEIVIANYTYVKQDLIPDLKSSQAGKVVETGCLKVRQGDCKMGEGVQSKQDRCFISKCA